MADYYADNTNGDDTTGDGSSGNPWATIQKAVDNATGGDTIHLANTSAFVLSSSVNWTLFGATSADAPLLITSWDNGGSITIDFPAIGGEAATSRVAAEIDGNDAVSSILSSSGAPLYVYLNGLQMHSTTGALVGRLNGWTLNECEFWDSSGAAMVSGSGAGNVIQGIILWFFLNGSLPDAISRVIGCSIILFAECFVLFSLSFVLVRYYQRVYTLRGQ